MADAPEVVAKLSRIARFSRQDCYTLRRALDAVPPTKESRQFREAVSDRLREISSVQGKALLKSFGL